MTFEEWLGDRIETMSSYEYAAEKAAWESGWAEGLAEGYDVGYSDTGICPECLNEVKHKMDCRRGR